jgi:coenzyme F420-0:L-glutamate ligase/coenzyme F420-1:gamma-L-glutamate ligase
MPSEISLRDAVFGRRSLRRYRLEPVPRDVLLELLHSAIHAPSAHNRQPWRFAVTDSPERKQTLAAAMGERLRRDLAADGAPADVIEADEARSYDRITSAPAIVIVCLTMTEMDVYPDAVRTNHEWTMAVQSVAMAGQNLMLSAYAAGLGACWMCAPLFCPDVVRNALELPVDWQAQGLITLGYPAQERSCTRKPLEESVLWR